MATEPEKRIFERSDVEPSAIYAKKAADNGDASPLLGSSSGQLLTTNGINLPVYDFVDLVIVAATETYKFRSGGSTGTLVATVTIVYLGSDRNDIFTVAKT